MQKAAANRYVVVVVVNLTVDGLLLLLCVCLFLRGAAAVHSYSRAEFG